MVLASYNPIFFLYSGSHSIKGWEFIMLGLAKGMMGVGESVLRFWKKKSVTLEHDVAGGGGGGNMKFCMVQAIVFWLFVKLRWSLKTRLRLLVKVKKLERGQSCWCEAESLVTASCGYMCIYSIALNIWGWLCWGTQFSSQSSHYQ